ncbi:hypothetical protein PVAND_010721 [Polypedilum vanderplanki]|uniref:Integrase catalytic domain-containing protein n=1 Tax=Polypedilum vanderplanki TaxID=319348 RepID=A0A9J6CI68_POLVA|nr:hypothetical protein PVAND_010721 [Polypedilum vanderplanki]
MVQKCLGCTAVARDNPPEPMIRTFLPHKPMDFVAIDHWSAAIITSKLLIITDYYSRYLWVIEVRDTTSVETIKACESVFNIFENRLQFERTMERLLHQKNLEIGVNVQAFV